MDYEYRFSTLGGAELLRVKGPAHTNFTGFREVVRKYPSETITDRFRVVRKLKSEEDREGNRYDWYEIDRHYRTRERAEQEDGMEEMAAAYLEGVKEA